MEGIRIQALSDTKVDRRLLGALVRVNVRDRFYEYGFREKRSLHDACK